MQHFVKLTHREEVVLVCMLCCVTAQYSSLGCGAHRTENNECFLGKSFSVMQKYVYAINKENAYFLSVEQSFIKRVSEIWI